MGLTLSQGLEEGDVGAGEEVGPESQDGVGSESSRGRTDTVGSEIDTRGDSDASDGGPREDDVKIGLEITRGERVGFDVAEESEK